MYLLSKTHLFACLAVVSLSLTSEAQKTYELNPSPTTVAWGHYWSETPPALRIKSGDYVRVHTLLTSNPERLEGAGLPPDQVEKELREVQVVKDRGPGGHILTGPIYIEEAEPGDILEVKINAIELAIPYGYNAIGQNGFLSDEIFDRKMQIIKLDKEKMIGHFANGIEIPLRPFFGSMGVAPPQGNGEVDITAIETSLKGTLQFIVHKGKSLKWPRAETTSHIITMGCDRDLNAATHIAVREMIQYLMQEKKLSQSDAYMLCSIAVDVNITQLVDGNVGVHAMLPKSIFAK